MVAAVVIQTDLGRDKLAKLAAEGKTLKLTQFAVGDANDKPYTPTGKETKLVHEKYRSDISLIEKDEVSAATLKIINIVPSTSGGYTIREIGLFDEDNDLIAIGVCEIIKPDPKVVPYTSKITILLTIDNAESVEFKINIDGYVTHDYALKHLQSNTFKQDSELAVSRLLLDKVRESISVKDFGAVGDGVTDDSIAFANATAYISSGGKLLIPKGTYLLNNRFSSAITPTQGKISLFNKSNIKIVGESGTVLRISNWQTALNGGVSIIHLSNCNYIQLESIRFELTGVVGLLYPKEEPNYPTASCIYVEKSNNININNCSIYSYNETGADGSSPQPKFYYKQIPIFVQGDTSTDKYRGFTFTNSIIEDTNTYKMFIMGMGNVLISKNRFIRISGFYPCVRNLVHASRGHIITDNYFEGADPANDVPSKCVVSTNTPSMILISNASNKGGGSVNIANNTFALTGSGGIDIGDLVGVTVASNTFYDFCDMSSILTIENDTKSCIRLNDEASGSGSYPASNVAITNNSTLGKLSRKGIQITHAYNGNITANCFNGITSYGIKAAKARNYVIAHNNINNVNMLNNVQVCLFTSCAGLASGETIKCHDNTIKSFVAAFYNPDKLIQYNNTMYAVDTSKTTGLQDSLSIDNVKFFNSTALAVNENSNVLHSFEDGIWTPQITFENPGDLIINYTTQKGTYQRIKNTVKLTFHIFCNRGFYFSSASGALMITNLPFKSRSEANRFYVNALNAHQAISVSQLNAGIMPDSSVINIHYSGDRRYASVTAQECRSGDNLWLVGEISYKI